MLKNDNKLYVQTWLAASCIIHALFIDYHNHVYAIEKMRLFLTNENLNQQIWIECGKVFNKIFLLTGESVY